MTQSLPTSKREILERMLAAKTEHVPDEQERLAIYGVLVFRNIPERDRDWMTEACPSLACALDLYPIDGVADGR